VKRRLVILGAILVGLVLWPATSRQVQNFAAVKSAYQSSEARLHDRHGELIQTLRVDNDRRRLAWTSIEQVSPALIAAVLRAEDKRFHSHHGVDWLGAISALWSNATEDGALRGASTITMQLAAQLDPSLRSRYGQRSLRQKWKQMQSAWALEQQWTKAQILEAYLNLITFRGELQGVASATRGLLDKEPSGVTQPEAAVLAALIRAPNAKADQLGRRACALAQALSWGRDVGPECSALSAIAATIANAVPKPRQDATLAPHVARQLLKAEARQVATTLDIDVQRYATEALRHQLLQLRNQTVSDGAVLVVDNVSGEVLAYVGNAGTNPHANYVDGVRAMRQAGSTLKPFLYGLAIDQRRLTAASLLNDTPVNLETPTGMYVPQNYDKEFRGWVSARTALAGSLNVPAVRTLMLVGVDAFTDVLRRLGFEGITESGEYYGYSLALGSAEVNLWQLVNGYRALANAGHAGPLSLLPANAGSATSVLTPGAAFIVSDMLADRGARAVTFGLDNPIALPFWAAVKTGTSKDMRDNWCVGYSSRFTVGVWVGNFNGEPMRDVSGVTGAAPVWAEVMQYLHRGVASVMPRAPENVVSQNTRFQPIIEPPRSEYFLRGTEMTEVTLNAGSAVPPRIAYPGEGMVIALDPDIPRDRQRVFFSTDHAGPAAHWRLDGVEVSDRWQPAGGEHALQLVDVSGHVLDRVRFIVRGQSH
jgi:penicillin-binding protein 1C